MIDIERIGMLHRDLGAVTLAELIRDFEIEAEDILARLMARPRPGAERMAADLHMLRGSAMTLGCTELAEGCANAERKLQDDGQAFDPARLHAAYEACRERLTAWSSPPPPGS